MTSHPSRRSVLSGAGALAAGLAAGKPRAARASDFYQGKTLTVIVGFAPGGGVDTTARMVARHLVRFIPGQPSLVIQNMAVVSKQDDHAARSFCLMQQGRQNPDLVA